jgi:precorrin-2 dehydrogenase/sirohydrochlorin ferrochelatase
LRKLRVIFLREELRLAWRGRIEMSLYPVFLKLEGRKVLVVGGGSVAEQKIEGVLRSASDVTVLAPRVNERIRLWAELGWVKHVAAEYRKGMAQGYFLVITCTDSAAVNHAVYEEARKSGALANAVDDPDYCDFYASAVVSRGEFQIAISTGGASPALAQHVRKELEQEFGPEYGPWTAWLGRMRALLRQTLPPSEQRKRLLHLLALCKPARISRDDQNKGDDHGPFETERTGSKAQRYAEGASA